MASRNILIIEDETSIRHILSQILETESDYRIFTAQDAVKAREILKSTTIDLVLSDIHMPGESGLELARFIKKQFSQTGIVLVSVIADPETTRAALDIGLYGYLLKPFDSRQVLITVENALRRQELEIQNQKRQRELQKEVFEKSCRLKQTTHEIGEARSELTISRKMLHEQILFLQTLLDAIPYPVFYKDLNGCFLGCNASFEKFLMRGRNEIIGRTAADFDSGKIALAAKESDAALLRNKPKVTYESCLQDARGKRRTLIITKALYRDIDGQPAGIVGVMLDISKRKQSEAALQASEEKVRRIIDNISIGVVLLSPELKLLEMNRQMYTWFPDVRIEEHPHCHEVFLSPPNSGPCSSCPSLNALGESKCHETNSKIFRDGRWCDFRIVSTPIHDSTGKVIAVIQMLEDITEKLAMERELMQSQKLASIGQLAAGVAHEINNPTGFVSSNLKTLDDYQKDLRKLIDAYQNFIRAVETQPDTSGLGGIAGLIDIIKEIEAEIDIEYIQSDLEALLSESMEGTERIKKIVEDMKNFAHPGQDKVQDTDINKGLESTLNIVNNELKYKATVIREFGDLPIISANPQQINQVFANILVNAAQAIEDRGEIRIQTMHSDGFVEIRISDTGCGIPEQSLVKIFDPFFTTKEVGKGTGLGMNIAYNIIRKHHGDIKVNSRVGEGTEFIIRLPVNTEG